ADLSLMADTRTVIFTGVAALLTGLLTGLAPGLQALRLNLVGDLKAGAREGSYRRSRMRVGLLVAQGALSVVLVVGAGLLVRSLGDFDLNDVSPDYFATMGTRILRGRGVSAQDIRAAPQVMVVSDAMAKALWPGQDAIGQCVKVGADTTPCRYVVGVAENIKS